MRENVEIQENYEGINQNVKKIVLHFTLQALNFDLNYQYKYGTLQKKQKVIDLKNRESSRISKRKCQSYSVGSILKSRNLEKEQRIKGKAKKAAGFQKNFDYYEADQFNIQMENEIDNQNKSIQIEKYLQIDEKIQDGQQSAQQIKQEQGVKKNAGLQSIKKEEILNSPIKKEKGLINFVRVESDFGEDEEMIQNENENDRFSDYNQENQGEIDKYKFDEQFENISKSGKLQAQRNRKIAFYIGQQLKKLPEGTTISNKKLSDRVLSHYDKKTAKIECIRRRVYECLSILTAVEMIDKKNKEVCLSKKKKSEKTAMMKQAKFQLQKQTEEKSTELNFLKHKYHDYITQMHTLKSLIHRNKEEGEAMKKISQPVKVLVCYRPSLILRIDAKKQSEKTNYITIQSQKYLYPLHELDLYHVLRKVIPLQPILQTTGIETETEEQYQKYIEVANKYEQNNRTRQELFSKLAQRSLYRGEKKPVLQTGQKEEYNLNQNSVELVKKQDIKYQMIDNMNQD